MLKRKAYHAFLLLLVTPNNQFLTMAWRRCLETARKMMKMSEVKAFTNVDDDEVLKNLHLLLLKHKMTWFLKCDRGHPVVNSHRETVPVSGNGN